MTRTRQVYPRDTLCHRWAHALQDSARDSGGSMYFTGPVLFSYGDHFAIGARMTADHGPDLAGRVIWNRASYSNTTTRHQSHAWRAMTSQQRQECLPVPALSGETARETLRALRDGRLPALAGQLVETVRDLVSKTANKKPGAGPELELLRQARDYEATGRFFYARAGRTWPLPDMPDPWPADKTARAELVRAFALGRLREEYATATAAHAKHAAARAELLETLAGSWEEGARIYGQDPLRTLTHVRQALQWAEREHAEEGRTLGARLRFYALIHGADKKPRGAKACQAAYADAGATLRAARTRYEVATALASLDHYGRAFFRETRAGQALRASIAAARLQENRDILQRAGHPVPAWLEAAITRGDGLRAAAGLRNDALTAAGAVQRARDYTAGSWRADGVAGLRDALRRIRTIQAAATPGQAAHLLRDLPTADQLQAEIDAYAAEMAAREAEVIRAWQAGETSTRPSWQAGTYARVRGDVVETTRGATVPLAHACRLVRIFDRVRARGGQDWRDGSGPLVGHFRVNHIGPDGALVIGCHEFAPAEALRLRDLLAACPDCSKTAAADTLAAAAI